ncbi:SDR family NAD(P)-dependent oxidoreductase [Peribacillus acanthi]|uniref:SDR family NAD(P)-dependent oxidoreductase n=1 Tax=Peribacillus acanthi TaxID=2171554 RepID=UPI000D3E39B9|nr:SDR family oxidoreductase [Peribacillus acanthi]
MKAVLITGGGSGLGKEVAFLFAKQGYHIILTGRNEDKLENVKSEISASGGKSSIHILDIRKSNDIVSLKNHIQKDYDLEILINNAGIGFFGPIEEIDDKQIIAMLETNVLGTILMTKTFLPLLKKQQSTIIQIISTAGLRGKVNETVYCASKFAVRGFSEGLQQELDGTSVKIVNVYMGGMDTPFWDESDHIADKTRLRSPKEIAELISNQYKTTKEIIIESKK